VTKTKIGKVNGDHSYSGFGETVVDTYKMNDQLLYQRRYNRDPLGKIQGVVESGSATKSTQYVYNVRGKLADVIENGQKVRSYNYDANGNRLFLKNGHVTTNYKYDAQDRLIRAGSMSFEYTPSGELLKSVMNKKVTSYKYDAFGNLKSVTLPDARRIEYLVDGLHRRVAKKINGQMVQGFLYQSQTQIAAEVDGQNRIVKRFVYGEKLNIPDYMIYQKKNYRIISDQVGTPRMLIEVKTGNVVAQYNYDEFGVLISRSGSVDIPFGFAGGLKDDDTGLVRFGARDYNPSMGRWTAKDPILFNGGDTNLYGYVLNDPVNFVDMNGKNPLLIVGIGATVGAVANVIGTALAGGSIQDIGRSAVTGSIAGAAATLGAVGAVGLGASTALTVTLSSLVDITVQLSFAPDQFENLQEYSSGIENLIKPKVQQFCE